MQQSGRELPKQLCPDGPMTDEHLTATMRGYGQYFLGAAKYGKDFFSPRYANLNADVFVTEAGVATPEYVFKAVVFGEITTLPYVDWGTHTWLSIAAPKTEYGMGMQTLFEENDLYKDWTPPQIWDWKGNRDGQKTLIIDVDANTMYFVALKGGEYGQVTGPHHLFPFTISDTVVVEVVLQWAEVDFSDTDYCRVEMVAWCQEPARRCINNVRHFIGPITGLQGFILLGGPIPTNNGDWGTIQLQQCAISHAVPSLEQDAETVTLGSYPVNEFNRKLGVGRVNTMLLQ
ncbi:hypothetical protein C8R43DRAFT_953490 [Mycena crocata]|nr:hypothetical protein C8R43DRAFT_953490 [Mycena crocata]